jgi:carbonic anhydrase
VRRSISAILEHPWIPTSGPDAVSVRGFIYDVDTGLLAEVSYPGSTGSIG